MLTVQAGEKVECSIHNRPNEKNKRDLDIKIQYRLETPDAKRAAEGTCLYKMC